MLRDIQLPLDEEIVKEVISLQRVLLTYACHPQTTSDMMTVEKIANKLPRYNKKWLKSLCTNKHETISAINHWQMIAELLESKKEALLQAFEADLTFTQVFDDTLPKPFRFSNVQALADLKDKEYQQIRLLFEAFYEERFRAKYTIPQRNGTPIEISYHKFVDDFALSNGVTCCYCDGPITKPEVDHFYPKSSYIFLSFHPLNLVPVCDTCNGHKLTNRPFDEPAIQNDNIFHYWPHPYLRNLHDQFDVVYEQQGNQLIPKLIADDPLTERRLDNFITLIKAETRWQTKIDPFVKKIKDAIDTHYDFDKLRDQHAPWEEIDIQKLLIALRNSAIKKHGNDPFNLIWVAFLEHLIDGKSPHISKVLWQHYEYASSK